MFNKKKVILNSKISKRSIKVRRDSVCLADDCTSPNEKEIVIMGNDNFLEMSIKIAQCLPQMNNVIWGIDNGFSVLGYIIVDENFRSSFEICEDNSMFSNMNLNYIHCSYFHSRSFLHCDTEDGEVLENYRMCKTMLEKVKYHMNSLFLQNLKISGGCICIWGEWFGRPYDNFHKVQSLHWKKDEIAIQFDQGESLYIKNPIVKKNERDEFIVEDATDVLWTWYAYGKENNYENLYVRQYHKMDEGTIIRAEGRRKDVSERDGSVFQLCSNVAVILSDFTMMTRWNKMQ